MDSTLCVLDSFSNSMKVDTTGESSILENDWERELRETLLEDDSFYVCCGEFTKEEQLYLIERGLLELGPDGEYHERSTIIDSDGEEELNASSPLILQSSKLEDLNEKVQPEPDPIEEQERKCLPCGERPKCPPKCKICGKDIDKNKKVSFKELKLETSIVSEPEVKDIAVPVPETPEIVSKHVPLDRGSTSAPGDNTKSKHRASLEPGLMAMTTQLSEYPEKTRKSVISRVFRSIRRKTMKKEKK